MYNLIVTRYPHDSLGKQSLRLHFDTFASAYSAALMVSFTFEQFNANRPSMVDGPINHYDYYSDIYNQGCIEVISDKTLASCTQQSKSALETEEVKGL